jgi:hypothetical protein
LKGEPFERSLRRGFAWLALATFCLTFLKGFRFPNLWVATQYSLNYSQGFVRRGLIGELARILGNVEVYRYKAVVVASLVLMAVVLGVVVTAIRRALATNAADWSFRVALLVFLSSPGLVFFVHAVGYLDYFGVLFGAGFLVTTYRATRPLISWGALFGMAILMAFIHEGLAGMFGPVLLFTMASQFMRLHVRNRRRRSGLFLVVLLVTAAAVLFGFSGWMSTVGAEDFDRVQKLARYVRTHADFTPRAEVFEVLCRSSKVNATVLMPWYWSNPYHVRLAGLSWQVFTPGFLAVLVYGVMAIARLRIRLTERVILMLLYLPASVAPLLMNFIGWDWNRWNGLALVCCLLATLSIKLNFPVPSRQFSVGAWTLGIILTMIGLASTTPLFDGDEVQFVPFERHIQFFKRLADGAYYRPRA